MQRVQRFRNLEPGLLLLQRPDVQQVLQLQRHRPDGFRFRSRRIPTAKGVQLLQRGGDLKLHLLVLQRHGEEREFQVFVLRRKNVLQVLQL